MPQGETPSKPESLPDLSVRVRFWRQRAGLRPVELARAIDMSESSVSRWESGTATPSTRAIEKIAEACGVSLGMFFSELPGGVGVGEG